MIVDSLRYWVEEMHVDGFRFDLASILSRDASGHVLANPPVLWDIESDPALAGTKLIAEAWDAAGLYQVGSFVGDAGGSGTAGSATTCAVSSAATTARCGAWRTDCSAVRELYATKQREAEQSVNFVTCHDGFTLNDLVSYNEKHNEANGEENRDGATTIAVGTAAWKDRPTIPRSRICGTARSRISWPSRCSRWACR